MTKAASELVDTKRSVLRALSAGAAPRYLMAAVVVLVGFRAVVGGGAWTDLALIAVLVIIQPFVEWLIHVHVLHAPPRTFLGVTVDPGADHRAHHRRPHDLTILFFSLPHVIGGQVAFALIFAAALRSVPLVLTGVTTVTVLSLYYEWNHLIAHTAYRPHTRYFRGIWRAHRLHHFKSEHYWYGITNTIADRVLHTFPDKASVPTSPTAQDLFGEHS